VYRHGCPLGRRGRATAPHGTEFAGGGPQAECGTSPVSDVHVLAGVFHFGIENTNAKFIPLDFHPTLGPDARAERLTHHRSAAVIDLAFFSRGGEDHRPRLWYLGSAQLVSEAPTALIATLESVAGNQILPDGHGIAIPTQTQPDDFPVGFTGASRCLTAQPHAKVGGHLYGRF